MHTEQLAQQERQLRGRIMLLEVWPGIAAELYSMHGAGRSRRPVSGSMHGLHARAGGSMALRADCCSNSWTALPSCLLAPIARRRRLPYCRPLTQCRGPAGSHDGEP